MALPTRYRWMLYGAAALLTAGAIVAVQPARDDADIPVVAPAVRTARTAPVAAHPLQVPLRPYAAAGRSPFGDSAGAGAAAAAQAAATALPPAGIEAGPPPPRSEPELPFAFLGRWIENGRTTVLLARDGRQFAAVAGTLLTPDYRVEHVGERELRLIHLPTGKRYPLALVAGRPSAPAGPGAAPRATDTEELN
jgi:hypothetical protein